MTGLREDNIDHNMGIRERPCTVFYCVRCRWSNTLYIDVTMSTVKNDGMRSAISSGLVPGTYQYPVYGLHVLLYK